MTKTFSFMLGLSFAGVVAFAAQKAARTPAAAASGSAQRGRYLVEDVGMCGECHSPRDAQGSLDRSRWLQGAPVWFTPIHPTRNWAYAAPALAGLPSFSDADMVNILQKGLTPAGAPIRPPMHVYRLTREDALAVVAYLRSLKPAGGE